MFQNRLLPRFYVACFIVLPALAQAEVYKWVDDHGVVTYSQTSPGGGNYQAISPRVPTVDQAAARERLETLQENLEEHRLAREKEKIEGHHQSEKLALQQGACDQMRSRLTALQSRPHVLLTEADGSTRKLPEEERQERIAGAREFLAKNCGSSR